MWVVSGVQQGHSEWPETYRVALARYNSYAKVMQYLRIGCNLVSSHIDVVSAIRRGYLHCRSIDISVTQSGRSSRGSLRPL